METPQHTYISGDMTHFETYHAKVGKACADPESFARGGPTLTTFFFVLFFVRGERIQIELKAGIHSNNAGYFSGDPDQFC